MTVTNGIETPAFVTDEKILQGDLTQLRAIADQASCKLLYSPKASALSTVLQYAARQVDGFACSSPFELRLVGELSRDNPGDALSSHLVSPLIKPETLKAFGEKIDYLTMNSLSQWERLRGSVSPRTSVGLRLNPQLSFVRDARYDPCRPHSKLGISFNELAEFVVSDTVRFDGINGLHFHTNCEGTDFADLLATARHIQTAIPMLLHQVDWINLGGGYLFDMASDHSDFYQAVAIFRDGFGLEVFIEPGAAAVRRSGTVEATVHDIVRSDDMLVAILDTSVNHMPEVFEFQFEPDILGQMDGGLHSYILAGCTCLPGDEFGNYSFDRPLRIGSKIKFLNMGAYTMSKAHRFNGVALPTIYRRGLDGSLNKVRADHFGEFAQIMGSANVAVA